ncbi:MAG: phosphatase PAP2 family protein [Bacteriovoracaceae bacterium]|nr:phosphatase PAP2 family protein [Bacteriovoracaceae bacterium]
MKYFLTLIVLLTSFSSMAEEPITFFDTITEIPDTSMETLKTSFSKESLPYWGIILGSTGVLYYYDEQLLAYSQKKGRDWRIGNHDNTKPVVTGFGQELVRLPTDTGSWMYFLGDGWMHAGIAGGFIAAGKLKSQQYEVNTGMMIIHGMFVSTIFNQALKRSFGRESPNPKTTERGAWNLFPSFDEYNTKTGSYDAMPSGHVMTATMTFTVLAERYPQHRKIIYPLAGVWVTALSFQMMNNGVHWASDYPLGIAMGYVVAKMAVKMGQKKTEEEIKSEETSWMFMPMLDGRQGMVASRMF